MKKTKKIIFASLLSSSLLFFHGCLKTRAQLKKNPNEEMIVAPIKDVSDNYPVVLNELKQEVNRIEGRLEEIQNFQKSQDSLVVKEEEFKILKEKVEKLEEQQTKLTASLEAVEVAKVSQDPEKIFQKAKNLYQQKKYEEAYSQFEFYTHFQKVKKLEEASFLKGDCFYQLKKYKKAIVEFSKFPEKYKKSSYMPEALYKIALSFDSLGMPDEAQGFYQEILEKYPNSVEAKKSKKKQK